MSRSVIVHRAPLGLTVQDFGRRGHLTIGVSRGGAIDPVALWEGAALLGQDPRLAAMEMAGMGGEFEATDDMRIALTGAPMKATLDGQPLRWNASHAFPSGAKLVIGALEAGNFGYLVFGGGVMTPEIMGSRSVHVAAGIGAAIVSGDVVPIGPDPGQDVAQALVPEARFSGGFVRVVPSLQTDLFNSSEIARFEATTFRRDPRSNRMGARLTFEGAGFAAESGLSILSEVIVPGDIQITGDGTPFVLMNECQTVGGYPRIGSVLPADLPIVAQASATEELRFEFATLEDAIEIERRAAATRAGLAKSLLPLIRDPHSMRDLLSFQLISGVTVGD